MALTGANVEELRLLGAHMRQSADRLEQIRVEITAAFSRVQWEGDDADHCRADWRYRASGLLHVSAMATLDAAVRLRRNADEQWAASAGSGFGAAVRPGWQLAGVDAVAVGAAIGIDGRSVGTAYAAGPPFATFAVLPLGPIAVSGLRLLIQAGPRIIGAWQNGTGIVEIIREWRRDPDSPETYAAIGGFVFGAAAEVAATRFGGPWAGALVGIGAGWAYDQLEAQFPGITKDVVQGVLETGRAVGDAAVDTDAAIDGGVEDAAGAAGRFIEGGVSAADQLLDRGVDAVTNLWPW